MQKIVELFTKAKQEKSTVRELPLAMRSRPLLSLELLSEDQYSKIISELGELKELFRQNATASVQNSKDDLLNLSQAVTYTGLSKSFWYKITAAKELNYYQPNGKTIFFKRGDIDNFLCRRKIQSNQEISLEAEQSLLSHRLRSV